MSGKKGTNISTDLSKIDSIPDTRTPKHRGYLATNTVSEIRTKAKARGKSWSLTSVEAYYMIIGKCEYCGYKPNWPNDRNGIDRIDSNIDYLSDNCVSCCFRCNSAKNDMTVDQFKEWIDRVYKHQHKRKKKKVQDFIPEPSVASPND